MITTTTKTVHSTILKIFLIISFLSVLIIFTLANGIEIPKINLSGFKIHQFYIKLDKKLIISIKSIEIKAKKSSGKTLNEVNNIIKIIQYLPHYFQKVKIDNLQIGQNRINLLYYNDIFYIDTDILQLSSKFVYDPKLNIINVDIKKLHLKDSQIALNGQFNFFVSEKKWEGIGAYKAFKLNGNFLVAFKNETIYFKLNSNETSSIKELIDYIAPPEPIKAWIYPKIPAKRYKLHYLTGSIKLKKDGSVEFDPQKLKAFATAYSANIHFNSNVPPVHTKKIDITLKNDTLRFKLYDPIYEGKKLNGSFVQIRNLTNSKAELDAHIVVNDKVDNSIKTILSAYDINLPFVQTQGKTKAVVDFTVKLVTGDVIKYEGDYKSKYAKLLFDNTIELPVKNLHIISKDNEIDIKNAKIKLPFTSKIELTGKIYTDKKIAKIKLYAKKIKYKELFLIKNKSFDIDIDFKKNLIATIPKLNLNVIYDNKATIYSNDISKLSKYFKNTLSIVKKGEIKAIYKNGSINATYQAKDTTLKYKNISLPCDTIKAKIKTNPLKIEFTTKHNDGEIRGVIENSLLNVTGKQLPDFIIRKITTLDYIYGGFFDFNAIGNIDSFNGTILVHNSLWAKNAFYNNVLAMLNTIPAVLTLKNPGFSNKGFKIKKGAIAYHYKNNTLYFDNILMNGDSAQITGKGKINFKSETILMLMQIHFLENLTNILNKIPIAGYLIFGDDGTMAVTLNISGYLDNPKVTTETIKDVVQVPLNILDRVLTLPFKLFE